MKDLQDPALLAEILKDFRESFPALAKIFLDERDEYMYLKIIEHLSSHPDEKTLIIVGGGHLYTLATRLQKI